MMFSGSSTTPLLLVFCVLLLYCANALHLCRPFLGTYINLFLEWLQSEAYAAVISIINKIGGICFVFDMMQEVQLNRD